MSEKKYENYIITDYIPPKNTLGGAADLKRIIRLGEDIIAGGTYVETGWILPGAGEGSGPKAHVHDFDEVIGFIGSDTNNPKDLGAEAEIWLGDEKYILTGSHIIFAPKGLRHAPFIIRNVTRPVFHFTFGNTAKYDKDE